MSRWNYDTVFYRVFCITLLAVAFTFTVILTNVFVDIDGLMSRKDKATTPKPEPMQNDISELMNVNIPPGEDKSEDVYEDKDYQDSNDLYRSKRSLESPDPESTINKLFHIKDPTLKKVLSNRLALLLDELDEENNFKNNNQNAGDTVKENKIDKTKLNNPGAVINGKQLEKDSSPHNKADEINKNTGSEYLKQLKKISQRTTNESRKKAADNLEEELLHLAMHNIVLQGIIGNMKLDDVYTKVVHLVNDFEPGHPKHYGGDFRTLFQGIKHLDNHKEGIEKLKSFDEHIKDLNKLSDLENIISSINSDKEYPNENTPKTTSFKPKGHNIMIKTIIDITALTNDKSNKESDSTLKEKLNGVVKLIYNGKSIKFKRVDDDITNNSSNIYNNSSANITENSGLKKIELIDDNYHESVTYVPSQSYYRKTINDYLNRFPSEDSLEHDKVYKRKRLKRHIKIRIDNDKTTVKPKVTTQDDELFVEIETHFDSKGAKGEKKKKLVRNLIEKIQRAIRSEKTGKKKKRHWHVKKRTQETLGSKSAAALINKLILPFQTLAHRHMDPISKSVPMYEDMPLVLDEAAHNRWNGRYESPTFFDKSINSAEMSTVNVDYNKIMIQNGIPQRLQKPLNTDMSDEILQNSTIYDLGNIKFLMKDVDGSGFSIGFNQYMDQAPDPETMKIFSGLENIIQTYHQKYDQELGTPDQQQNTDNDNRKYYQADSNEYNNYEYQQMDKPEEHLIERRSIKEAHHKPDHHSNKYKIIVSNDHNFLPYDNYQEIYESKKRHKNNKKYHAKQANSVLFVDDNVFEKDLKPGEILSIADMFQRRKRSFKVQKISNVKIKGKISRYLNTKSRAKKSFYLNKKRNKREIDKIRIVARDLPNFNKNSAEDIFVVSDEKVFADRAVVSEVELPEIEPHVNMPSLDHYNIFSPQKDEDAYDFLSEPHQVTEDHFDIVNPYIYEAPQTFDSHREFSRHARHNNLMSKYPHIFLDERTRSKEEMYPENSYAYAPSYKVETTTNIAAPVVTILDTPFPNDKQIAQLLSPPKDTNNNYKVTVKIRPKNSTGVSGFKEVHTSINKSYNKNGLIYTSLVNVSQLSKVEKMGRNKSRREFDDAAIVNLKQQQDIVKTLIRQHKSRIDDQLKQLYLEKEKLEIMDTEITEFPPDITPETFLDVGHLTDANKKLHLTKDEVSKLFTFKETTTTKPNTPVTQHNFTNPTTITTTTTTTTTEFVPQTTEDNVKYKIIETIEKNDNITNDILKKIDQNTGVLKSFLGKLIAKMDLTYKQQNVVPIEYTENPMNKKIISNMGKNEILRGVNSDVPFSFDDYQQSLHDSFFSNLARQSSNLTGIPFIYAYQQPYGTISNKESPIASVVYHGHIHTNIMTNKDIFKPDTITQYNKGDNTKQDFYKPDTKKSQYYKPGIGKPEYYKTKKIIEPENKEVLKEIFNKENLNKENDRKKMEVEKEFWNAKPGETVLQNFVMKNSSKFFMDDAGHDFKIYTPLRDVTLNITNVHNNT